MKDKPPRRSKNWIKDFSVPECDFFRANCNFTDREMRIFNMRFDEASAVEICRKLHISPETFYRDMKKIRWKIFKIL